MRASAAIEVRGMGKKFCRSLKRSALYGVVDVARGAIGLPLKTGDLRRDEFRALDGIDFSLAAGESLGVIGHNGAGKSTLLKVLSGIIEPDRGRVSIRGRVGALIQLGAGFHPQLTGRENIYVNGQILGMGRREIEAKFDRILAFAEIGDFLDTPVKYYSSGMFVRLGFAVAAHLDPDILLVDEVLSVGDMEFQARCMAFMSTLRERGTILLFVSHNEELVRRSCERAMLLDHGRCVALGGMEEVYAAYHRRVDWMPPSRSGNRRAEIDEVQILNGAGEAAETLRLGETMTLRVRVIPHEPIENPVLDVGFNCNRGYVAAAANNQDCGFDLGPRTEPFWIELRFPELNLAPGGYRLTVQIMGADRLEVYDWQRNQWPLYIEADRYVRGAAHLPVEWAVRNDSQRRTERKCSGHESLSPSA